MQNLSAKVKIIYSVHNNKNLFGQSEGLSVLGPRHGDVVVMMARGTASLLSLPRLSLSLSLLQSNVSSQFAFAFLCANAHPPHPLSHFFAARPE